MPHYSPRTLVRALFTLQLFVLAGCAGYMPAVMPGEVGNAGTVKSDQTYSDGMPISSNGENERIVKIGSEIRALLLNGEIVAGRVIGLVHGETITVADADHGGKETVIAVNEIETVEIRPSSYREAVVARTLVAVTVGVLVVLGAVWAAGGF